MLSKLEKEKQAIAAAKAEIAQREKRLAKLEEEERSKRISQLVKSLGQDKAINVLEAASALSPSVLIERLNGVSVGAA